MPVNLDEKPFFIVGQERSGSTLLMAILGMHSRLAVPEVSWWYPRFRGYLYSYGSLQDPKNLRTLADEMVFGLRNPLWGMPVNPRTVVDEVIGRARESSFEGIYCAMLEAYADWVGKPRWGEKTPNNLYFVNEILTDFPGAKIICITRDGRDMGVDAIGSNFGPNNAFVAAENWSHSQHFAQILRAELAADSWYDVGYERLVREPKIVLRGVCEFLGEDYEDTLLDFHRGSIAQERGRLRDHKALASPITDQYVGIYREQMSRRDQGIYASVAGEVHLAEGYSLDVEPIAVGDDEAQRYRELDACFRAAALVGPGGRLVLESYHDWLIDQREARRQRGIWSLEDRPQTGLHNDPFEEHIIGLRASRRWKQLLGIKRQYTGAGAV